MRSLPVGCSGVGMGTARAEAGMEHGSGGRWFAMEVQVLDRQQETGLEKEAGMG